VPSADCGGIVGGVAVGCRAERGGGAFGRDAAWRLDKFAVGLAHAGLAGRHFRLYVFVLMSVIGFGKANSFWRGLLDVSHAGDHLDFEALAAAKIGWEADAGAGVVEVRTVLNDRGGRRILT